VLSSLGTIRAALSHRRRLPGKKSATTATDAARRGAAARYGSPVRRYTQRAGDRSIMLSGRFWNPALRDKILCGRDAADVKKPRSRSGSRETRRLVRPNAETTRVRRDVRFSLMSKNKRFNNSEKTLRNADAVWSDEIRTEGGKKNKFREQSNGARRSALGSIAPAIFKLPRTFRLFFFFPNRPANRT